LIYFQQIIVSICGKQMGKGRLVVTMRNKPSICQTGKWMLDARQLSLPSLGKAWSLIEQGAPPTPAGESSG
jgi:hypothetical protein